MRLLSRRMLKLLTPSADARPKEIPAAAKTLSQEQSLNTLAVLLFRMPAPHKLRAHKKSPETSLNEVIRTFLFRDHNIRPQRLRHRAAVGMMSMQAALHR